jgi:hypothetical protein
MDKTAQKGHNVLYFSSIIIKVAGHGSRAV